MNADSGGEDLGLLAMDGAVEDEDRSVGERSSNMLGMRPSSLIKRTYGFV